MLESLLDGIAELGDQLRQSPIGRRDEGFETRPNQARQHRRGPARGNCRDHGRTVDNRRHNKGAEFGLVHDIDRDAASLGGLVNRAVDRLVVSGGDGQDAVIEQRGLEGRFLVLDLPVADQPGQRPPKLGGMDDDPRAGLKQQPDLACRNLAPADEGTGFTFKVQKYRQIVHTLCVNFY